MKKSWLALGCLGVFIVGGLIVLLSGGALYNSLIKLDPNKAPDDPARLAEFQKAQDHLSSALSRLLVVLERYPDLKATTNFRDLQAQLEGTENRITVER